MWFVALSGVLLIFLCTKLSMIIGKNKKSFTPEEMEQMRKEMCGKSKQGCREILRKYEKNIS